MRNFFWAGIFLLLVSSVVAAGPTIISYSGCGDPALNTSGLTCQNVTGCGVLTDPNTYYLLTANDSSAGTCFTFASSADNSILDLNSHTITYADFTIEQPFNQDFEIGAGTSATGWTASGNAERYAGDFNNPYASLWHGNYSLAVQGPTSDQTITGANTFTLSPGIDYAMLFEYYIYPDEDSGPGLVTVDIVRASDDVVLKSLVSTNRPSRGFQRIPRYFGTTPFTVASPTDAYVRITVSGVSAANQVFVDFIAVINTHKYGVDLGNGNQNTGVRNGYIRQGSLYCGECNTIQMDRTENAEVSNIDAFLGGPSTVVTGMGQSADTMDGYGASVHHNTFINNNYYGDDPLASVSFRDDNEAMIHFARGAGSTKKVYENNIWGSTHVGIVIGRPGAEIYNNNIQSRAKYDNGFTIFVPSDSVVYGNVINSRSRGIFFESTINASVYDNWVNISEQRSQDKDSSRSGFALQMEQADAGVVNCNLDFEVYNNFFQANTHSTGTGGRAIWLAECVEQGAIFNNTFVAMNNHPSNGQPVYAFRGGAIDLATVVIENNTFISNEYIIALGYAGPGVDNAFFKSNTFQGLTPPGGINFHTIYFNGNSYGMTFLDTALQGIADLTDVQFSAAGDYEVQWYLTVNALDGNNSANGATLRLFDKNGATVYGPTSMPTGSYVATLTEFVNVGGSTTYDSPYTVEVIYGGETQLRNVTLDMSKTETFTFNSNDCPLLFDLSDPCDCIDTTELGNAITGWYNDAVGLSILMTHIRSWKSCP